MRVGFIGLGAMGEPMARNLHRAGLLAGVWGRDTGRVAGLAAEWAVPVADSPAALAALVDAVVLCVSRDADVLAVVEALLPGLATSKGPGNASGKTVLDTSTVGAETARAAATLLATVGAGFLDCPVSGGVEGARQGTLAIMVGGEALALARVQPALAAMGRTVMHMGPVGAGQSTKAVNQIMAAGMAAAVTEALAFGAALGLDMDKVIEVVGSGAAANWFLAHRGRTMVAGTYHPGFKVELHRKDLAICLAMAEALHPGADAQLPLTAQVLADYDRLIAQGHGGDDISSLYLVKQARMGGV
jgi:3-hydroxyisobutyrate dehydrogenase